MTIIEGVDTAQNTRMTIIEGVDTAQNTRMTIIEGVNAGQNTFMQAAFNKANTSIQTTGDQTLTGNLTISKDLLVSGNLTVLGNNVTVNTSSFTVVDSMITLGLGNYTSDLLDIGFAGHYNDGVNAHSGLIRDAGTKEWYIFKGYTPELNANNNVDINDASFRKANVNFDYGKGNLVATTATVNGWDVASVWATQNTNTTAVNTFAGSAYGVANTASSNTVYLQGGLNTANANITAIQGVDAWQNTQITAVNTYANAAFAKANASGGNTITVIDSWLSNSTTAAASANALYFVYRALTSSTGSFPSGDYGGLSTGASGGLGGDLVSVLTFDAKNVPTGSLQTVDLGTVP
jgi:hypothetical protein